MQAADIANASPLQAIDPIKPAAPYVGGKKRLARLISERIAAIPHSVYAEVFVGMGGIFFARDARPRCEVINDWSQDVSTFFASCSTTTWPSWTCCAFNSPRAPISRS